jgi:predicted N-acetyltransferase YhbS
MLVRLYDLPDAGPVLGRLQSEHGIVVRRAQPWERTALRRFVEDRFSRNWADEMSVGFGNKPISIFVAQDGKRIAGFAAYECTRRDFFGPIGVDEQYQGRGIGRALSLACLHAMAEMGYAYAIIGGAGPKEFYRKACGAIVIEGSSPGIYAGDDIEHSPGE